MGKKAESEHDEARLKKKVVARGKGAANPEGDAALRALKKRLKRSQRKRRARASRLRHAAGKSPAGSEKPQAPAQT